MACRMLVLLGLVVLSACERADAAGDQAVVFRTLVQDTLSGVSMARTAVVRDAAAWAALWAEHGSRTVPPPAQPAVDFDTAMVLGVFSGAKPTLCHGLAIESVRRAGRAWTVSYRESQPRPGAMCPTALATPVHLIEVPKGEGMGNGKGMGNGDVAVNFLRLP